MTTTVYRSRGNPLSLTVRTSFDVDNTERAYLKKLKLAYKEIGANIRRRARDMIGDVDKTSPSRPPGRPPRSRTGNIRIILYDISRGFLAKGKKDRFVAIRVKNLPIKKPKFSDKKVPAIHEYGGTTAVKRYSRGKPRKGKKLGRKISMAERRRIYQWYQNKEKGENKRRGRWVKLKLPPRPYLQPAYEREARYFPQIFSKYLR